MTTSNSASSNLSYIKSVVDHFKNFQTKGFWTVSFFPLLIACIGIFKFKIFGEETKDKIIGCLIILFILIFLRLIWCLLYEGGKRFAQWMRNNYWGSCIRGLEKAQALLMISSDADVKTRKLAVIDGIELLHEIAKIVTGEKCGVSVKIPTNPGDDPLKWKVHTLVRDKAHYERDNEVYRGKEHRIDNNTAFITVISKLKDGDSNFKYINNDRKESKDYSSSSDGCYPSLEQYVSEIVSPIILPNADRQTLYEIRGFLCLDCPLKYPFKNADVTAAIVGTFAKMMHPLLTNFPEN